MCVDSHSCQLDRSTEDLLISKWDFHLIACRAHTITRSSALSHVDNNTDTDISPIKLHQKLTKSIYVLKGNKKYAVIIFCRFYGF